MSAQVTREATAPTFQAGRAGSIPSPALAVLAARPQCGRWAVVIVAPRLRLKPRVGSSTGWCFAKRLTRNDATATTIMAPITAPTMPPQSNLFVSPMPNRPWKIQKPTSAPSRPSPSEVSHDLQPCMCRKASRGISARAMAPATNPNAKAEMKLPTFTAPRLQVGCSPLPTISWPPGMRRIGPNVPDQGL